MANMNIVVVAGNLTRDPEIRYTPSGTPVLQLGLAVNNRIKKGDEWVDDPCFIDVVVFGKAAEYIAENTNKGSNVLVNGRLQYRSWEDKEGNRHSKHEIVAERIQTASAKQGSGSGGSNSGNSKNKSREPGEDDDVPF